MKGVIAILLVTVGLMAGCLENKEASKNSSALTANVVSGEAALDAQAIAEKAAQEKAAADRVESQMQIQCLTMRKMNGILQQNPDIDSHFAVVGATLAKEIADSIQQKRQPRPYNVDFCANPAIQAQECTDVCITSIASIAGYNPEVCQFVKNPFLRDYCTYKANRMNPAYSTMENAKLEFVYNCLANGDEGIKQCSSIQAFQEVAAKYSGR